MKERTIRTIFRSLIPGILAALLLCAATAAAEGVTRCLLIGYDRFVLMPSTEPASANNTEMMNALLEQFLPGPVTVTRRVNEPGTVDGFEALAMETFAGAEESDTALVYLSTHGLLTRKGGKPGLALLLSDGKDQESLEPERLRKILDRVPGKKILILDACHSGAAIGEGSAAAVNFFRDGPYRVLVSSGAEEVSWFWNAGRDAYTGTGYFTAALNSALRASDPEQIDPDGDGIISLAELTGRLREIHGASTVYCWPEDSREPMFLLPPDRHAGALLRGLAFGAPVPEGDAILLHIRFRAEEPVRLVYQLAPWRDGKWDFEHAVRLPDREKTGLTRGLLSPGAKERTIRLSPQSLGEEHRALMQIISLNGEDRIPAAEGSRVISSGPGEGICRPGQENPEGQ